jgi:hypothetical protein
MRKTQIQTWLIVFLAITNLITISTIFYHNYAEKQPGDGIVIDTAQNARPLNGRYMMQVVGFDEQQMRSFRDANQEFRPLAMQITREIDSIKSNMFLELRKNTPDTVQLNEMAREIGQLHGRLKYETYRFFLRIKATCRPGQKAELEKAFFPLFRNDINTQPGGPGHRHGWKSN